MNKADLANKVSAKLGMTRLDAVEAVDTTLSTIADTLARGEEVRLTNLGIFKITKRKARMGRNPHTGEPLKISARSSVSFKPIKAVRDALIKK